MNVKAGDKVAVYRDNRLQLITKVEYVTESGNIKVDGFLYRKDGTGRGFSVGRWHIEPATQNHYDIVEASQEINKLNKKDWRNVPLDKLRQIMAIIDEIGT